MHPPGDDTTAESASILDELERLVVHARSEMVRRWRLQGLSMDQLHLLLVLQGEGPLCIGRIAELRGVAQSNASLMVSRLAEQGLVAKERASGEDRRRVQVVLTKAGEALVTEFQFARRKHLMAVLEAMTVEERDEFRRAFRRFFQLVRTVAPSGMSAQRRASADGPRAAAAEREAQP